MTKCLLVLIALCACAVPASASAKAPPFHHVKTHHKAKRCRPDRDRHRDRGRRKDHDCDDKPGARVAKPASLPIKRPTIVAPPILVPPVLTPPVAIVPPVAVPPTPPAASPIQHVVVVVMENSDPSVLAQMPYLSGLAASGASATNYSAIGHFSADNYIAMTSGTTCCFDDSFQNLNSTPSIFSQLGSQAQTLAERGGGGYAQRHDPGSYYGFPSQGFTDGQPVDLTGKKFTLVIPGLCNDMHDCGASTGNGWLSRNVPSFLANPGTVVFVTFDEGSGGSQGLTTPPANRVAMVVAGPGIHGTDATAFNHYSLLRTTEDLLGLPAVGAASSATSMVGHLGL